jgi:hypothetical protein
MGIFGTKLYSDEFAALVKEEYRKLIGFGIDDLEAEKLVLAYYNELIETEYESVFWISLAYSEWYIGRLSENIKLKALEVIDSGRDLDKWNYAVKHENLKKHSGSRSYKLGLMDDILLRTQNQVLESEGFEKTDHEVQLRNMEKIMELFSKNMSISEETEEEPKELLEDPFLRDILFINGSSKKKLDLRKKELIFLRECLCSPQIVRKVAKPYFTVSPWKAGDSLAFRLKDLDEKFAELEKKWVAFRVLSVTSKPVSRILPGLAVNQDVSLGLYNYIEDEIPTSTELSYREYIPFYELDDVVFGHEVHKGIWLNLYSAKRELSKWEWKVISSDPDFSANYPEYFKTGNVKSFLVGFGSDLAKTVAGIFTKRQINKAKEKSKNLVS